MSEDLLNGKLNQIDSYIRRTISNGVRNIINKERRLQEFRENIVDIDEVADEIGRAHV